MSRKIIVGTRQSPLALAQTEQVIVDLQSLCAHHGMDYTFETKPIVTKGDRILDVTLSKVGGKGLFVKEIEQAMIDGEIHMAVHSMKDMPAQFPEQLVIGAATKRVDARDCLITSQQRVLGDLPHGAIVGTSSLRRAAQLKAHRPDLNISPIRGNIHTRLRKMETEGMDAIVLAVAGMLRMNWEDRISDYLPIDLCLPAVGQGALAIQCREDQQFIRDMLVLYNHEQTFLEVNAERSFLERLQGGCQVPIAAYAMVDGPLEGSLPLITLEGMVGSIDGETVIREKMSGSNPYELGITLAEKLIERGADKILAQFAGE